MRITFAAASIWVLASLDFWHRPWLNLIDCHPIWWSRLLVRFGFTVSSFCSCQWAIRVAGLHRHCKLGCWFHDRQTEGFLSVSKVRRRLVWRCLSTFWLRCLRTFGGSGPEGPSWTGCAYRTVGRGLRWGANRSSSPRDLGTASLCFCLTHRAAC